MIRPALVALVFACSGRSDERPSPAPTLPLVGQVAHVDASAAIDAPIDATGAPATLDEALAALRRRDFAVAADHIRRRVEQRAPKMRLLPAEAIAAALALLATADHVSIRELHAVMPRSTIELARAVKERGVELEEAKAIASYLVAVISALRFERLAVFDENHSHVIGREWSEIDYTGESMTWQSQRAAWVPRGVVSFERAVYIHAYFVGAEKLPHWERVYKPVGRLSQVTVTPSR